MLETMAPESLAGAVVGLLIMGWAAARMNLQWTIWDIPLFVIFVIGGVLIYGGIYIALTSISFFSDSKTDIQPIMYNIGNYGRYPVNLYHRIIQFVLTWVLPFAFVGFYPASYLLDRDHWMWLAFLTPVVGVVYFIFGVFCWNWGCVTTGGRQLTPPYKTEPQGHQAEEHAGDDVQYGGAPSLLFQQLNGLYTEGGKRGVGAQKARGKRMGDMLPGVFIRCGVGGGKPNPSAKAPEILITQVCHGKGERTRLPIHNPHR